MVKRKELVERLADKGYTKKSADMIIDDFIRVIEEALVNGEDVLIHGFGTFHSRKVQPRETVDMVSGERIVIPAHQAPRFIPGAQLKRWVRDGIIRE